MTATATAAYTDHEGNAYTGARDEQIAQWEIDLVSGRVFALAANGHASRFGYQPPATSRRYAEILTALAGLARMGDQGAAVAAHLIHGVNLYGTDAQQATALYRAAADMLSRPYHDVIGATGPEASRPSAHLHVWTPRMVLLISQAIRTAIGGGQPGWCESAVARKHGVRA